MQVSIQLNGKLVAAGTTTVGDSSSAFDFALARYNADGSLDLTFGSGGKVTTDFFGDQDVARGIVSQSDGKIVVAGHAYDQFTPSVALARYNADGSLDSTFGVGGKVTTPFSGPSQGFELALQTDGRLIVGGFVQVPVMISDFAFARYNSDGTLDATFGSGGKVTTDLGGVDRMDGMALQPDGKIVGAGSTFDSTTQVGLMALARYNSSGALDTSFGIGGKVAIPFSGYFRILDIVLQPDGKIVAASVPNSFDPSNSFGVSRFNTNGSLDPTFGAGGKVTTSFFGSGDRSLAIAVQPDGKIVAGGSVNVGTNNVDFGLVRYNGGITSFDLCLRDDSTGNTLSIDRGSGDYSFTNCGGISVAGRGTVTVKGCTITLQHAAGDRRVLARIDTCQKKATASVQVLSQGATFSILDRNTSNNMCGCT